MDPLFHMEDQRTCFLTPGKDVAVAQEKYKVDELANMVMQSLPEWKAMKERKKQQWSFSQKVLLSFNVALPVSNNLMKKIPYRCAQWGSLSWFHIHSSW